LQASITDTNRFYKQSDRPYRNIDLLVRRVFEYFSIVPQEFERLKELEEEINHFKNIKVSLKDISELQAKVEQAKQFPEHNKKLESELVKMSPEAQQAVRGMLLKEASSSYEHNGRKINIRHVANHYYIPMILSGETERIDYIKHIIQEESEVKFISGLEEYLGKPDNKLKNFDWWMFSKLDESLDEVYVPYYDGTSNRVREFKPDFIFWLEKGNIYYVVFIDPKGTQHTDYQRKIDGYRSLFEGKNGGKKAIPYNGQRVKVFTFLYTDNVDGLPKEYRRYWFDDIGNMLTSIFNK